MRDIDRDGLALCRLQALLFENSPDTATCSSPIFVRRFMNSEAARRMDNPSFLDGSDSPASLMAEVEEQYGPSTYGKVRYGAEVLHWMGYLYRYWAYTREWPSSQVYQAMPARELAKLYQPYHSLDPDQAIARIEEAKGLLPAEDLTARGVEALRRIRAQSGFDYATVNLCGETAEHTHPSTP